MTLAGSAEDFDASRQLSMRQAIADSLGGTNIEAITLTFVAASVRVLVSVLAADTIQAEAISLSLRSQFVDAETASALLNVEVEAISPITRSPSVSTQSSNLEVGEANAVSNIVVVTSSGFGAMALILLVTTCSFARRLRRAKRELARQRFEVGRQSAIELASLSPREHETSIERTGGGRPQRSRLLRTYNELGSNSPRRSPTPRGGRPWWGFLRHSRARPSPSREHRIPGLVDVTQEDFQLSPHVSPRRDDSPDQLVATRPVPSLAIATSPSRAILDHRSNSPRELVKLGGSPRIETPSLGPTPRSEWTPSLGPTPRSARSEWLGPTPRSARGAGTSGAGPSFEDLAESHAELYV